MKFLTALLFLVPLLADCKFAIVSYQVPALISRPDISNPDALLQTHQAIGCVLVTEKTVIIIHTLAGDVPDNTLVLPAGTVFSITPLEVPNDNANRPQVLPNVQDSDSPRDTDATGNRLRLMLYLRQGGIL